MDKEGVMKCHRCNGSMIYEKFYGEDGEFFGWRCIVCGDIIEPGDLEESAWTESGIDFMKRRKGDGLEDFSYDLRNDFFS